MDGPTWAHCLWTGPKVVPRCTKIGIMDKKMETTTVYWGYTVYNVRVNYLGFRVYHQFPLKGVATVQLPSVTHLHMTRSMALALAVAKLSSRSQNGT